MSTDPSPLDPARPPTNPTSRPTVPAVPPRSPPYAPSVGSVIGAAALFLFACVPYWYMMVRISEWRCCDPDNDGGLSRYFRNTGEFGDIDLAFFEFDVILLWILLGFLLIPTAMRRRRRVAGKDEIPGLELAGAFILFPLSLYSTFFALGLYERYHGWAIAVPILLPPLIGLYGIWARFPHAMHRADVTSVVVWGAMLVLTIAPFSLSYLDAWTYPNREPERTAEFRRLTPDSTLRDYLAFRPDIPFENRRKDWFEAMRRVKSRQTDAIMLLKDRLLNNRENRQLTREERVLSFKEWVLFQELSSNLWALDLEATPSLCEAFHEALRDETAKIDPIALSKNIIVNSALDDVWYQLRTIKWLAGANCDLTDPLTDIETKLRPLSSSRVTSAYQITDILNTLATLRQTH